MLKLGYFTYNWVSHFSISCEYVIEAKTRKQFFYYVEPNQGRALWAY